MQSLIIHGRQPALGRAELESLYGAKKTIPVSDKATIVDVDPCLLAFDRLGGCVKFCKILTTLETTNWKDIENFLIEASPGHSQSMPEGKMHLGLSAIGFNISAKQINATALTLKKAIKKTGRNVRVVPNKSAELNSAQVFHNNLTSQNGWELVFIRDKKRTLIAQTVKVQDIESYARRDRMRPKRDAKVGMLPPKLAQIIINLASGKIAEEKLSSICDIPAGQPVPRPILNQTLLDPFCGSGVVLQEALLMGYGASGSDLDPRMVDYTKQNLAWLEKQYGLTAEKYFLKTADATAYNWKTSFDLIASETYLGKPLSTLPNPELLGRIVEECDKILSKFLKNIARQTKPDLRLCLAVPSWKIKNGFKHLPVLDHLTDMGYNRLSFVHAAREDLIYHRENQVVARELIILERI